MTKLNIRKNTGKLLRHAAAQVENLSDNTPKAAVRTYGPSLRMLFVQRVLITMRFDSCTEGLRAFSAGFIPAQSFTQFKS